MRELRIASGIVFKRLVALLAIAAGMGVPDAASAQRRAARPPAAEAESKEDQLGRIFAGIVNEATTIIGRSPKGLFIYAETADDWIHVSVLKETAKRVTRFVIPEESRLPTLILLLRDTMSLKPKDRWSVIEFELAAGNQFTLRTKYPDEVRVVEDSYVLRDQRLKARFKDKPIVGPFPPRWKKPTPPVDPPPAMT